jgi:uncharacterized membrane-anchored protein
MLKRSYKKIKKKMTEINNSKGYVALFSTIILIAVFLLLFTGMFLIAVGGMQRISDKENAFWAESFANICTEEVLNNIRENTDYGGEEMISFEGGGYCEVGVVEDAGDGVRNFTVTGEVSSYVKTIEVSVKINEEAGVRTLEIVGWEEDSA